MKKTAQEAAPMVRRLVAGGDESTLKQLQAKGMTVTNPDIAAFRAAVKPALVPISNFSGKEFAAKFLKAVESARQK